MSDFSYVLHLRGSDDAKPLKHFRVLADAVTHGQRSVQSGAAEQANIYACGY
jgi:hypothetical protein